MKVGLALGWQNSDWDRYDANDFSQPPPVPDWEIYRENIRLLDLAEPLGFDSIFSIEHHMTPYHMTPSGPQLLAYLAGRTERIDLGTALIVVPWYNPVRLAEQICFLDNVLDEGRGLWLGVGRGTAPREYQAMGIDQNEARDRFKEGIDILRLALTEERFSYHGTLLPARRHQRPAPTPPHRISSTGSTPVSSPRRASRSPPGWA